jgi:hypothetical protein
MNEEMTKTCAPVTQVVVVNAKTIVVYSVIICSGGGGNGERRSLLLQYCVVETSMAPVQSRPSIYPFVYCGLVEWPCLMFMYRNG